MAAEKKTSGVRPSIHSVAAYAGVSIATVSKVMHGDKTVRPENVVSVQNAIEALGYRINPLAADLRRGRRKLVGIIVPSFDDPYYASFVGALERQAERRGYALAATSSRDSEKRELELVKRMEDWRVSGVILVPVKDENGQGARVLKASEMAAVFIDNVIGGTGGETIAFDYRAAIRDVVAQTARLGHQRMLVAVPDVRRPGPTRLASHLVASLKAAVPGAAVQVLSAPTSREKLAEALAEIFGSAERPTLVLSFSEVAVTLTLNIARRLDWNVPEDLSLFSFKPVEWMRAIEPAIGSVQLPIDGAAVTIMDTIFQKIDNKAAAAHDQLLPCKIDFGQSMTTPRGQELSR
ncbi:LacI family DNA-binding transcriptional regulator [Sinorhizobium meliloti]|nr:LacI family DNA-binding transcriptional regulator [Sinorhizobium meliloti]MDW9713549.1 LacI family DNA-binding transcriptional regulator [Sinorhizobium meliloti]MDW9750630.1 LacI family DNA-binding transcriptional regulator [Sinorhizobium meliloti]MDX0252302.1 LacI family DNA-binding transcriptional regulator [Sinorhizobium meliloti]MDX0359616.1 LacI family DNA-binding transcriptional regulator [Sinorhizobium meliloti]